MVLYSVIFLAFAGVTGLASALWVYKGRRWHIQRKIKSIYQGRQDIARLHSTDVYARCAKKAVGRAANNIQIAECDIVFARPVTQSSAEWSIDQGIFRQAEFDAAMAVYRNALDLWFSNKVLFDQQEAISYYQARAGNQT
jgi:hypothetical protein